MMRAMLLVVLCTLLCSFGVAWATPPAAPTGLLAIGDVDAIVLLWTPSGEGAAQMVYRSNIPALSLAYNPPWEWVLLGEVAPDADYYADETVGDAPVVYKIIARTEVLYWPWDTGHLMPYFEVSAPSNLDGSQLGLGIAPLPPAYFSVRRVKTNYSESWAQVSVQAADVAAGKGVVFDVYRLDVGATLPTLIAEGISSEDIDGCQQIRLADTCTIVFQGIVGRRVNFAWPSYYIVGRLPSVATAMVTPQ